MRAVFSAGGRLTTNAASTAIPPTMPSNPRTRTPGCRCSSVKVTGQSSSVERDAAPFVTRATSGSSARLRHGAGTVDTERTHAEPDPAGREGECGERHPQRRGRRGQEAVEDAHT